MVVAKVKLGRVAMQMMRADVLVNTVHAALENGEVAFDGIRMRVVADVFARRVIDGLMV
jgi:hypothetical protein